jgi:hypothetical protein
MKEYIDSVREKINSMRPVKNENKTLSSLNMI